MPKPCPFCGVELVSTRTGFDHRPVNDCPMRGVHIGKNNLDRWNTREPVLRMEIKKGRPVFSETEGTPTDIVMVNRSIEYYEKLATDASRKS